MQTPEIKTPEYQEINRRIYDKQNGYFPSQDYLEAYAEYLTTGIFIKTK